MKSHLILLHGALGCKDQLSDLKSRLNSDYDVHTLNFEGHGGVASDKSFAIDLFTQNVLDYCQSNGLKSVSLFGYSMGGYVALNLALKHSNVVKEGDDVRNQV